MWAYALRAWQTDESADMASTMAAVDRALDRAMQAEQSLPGRRPSEEPVMPEDELSEEGLAEAGAAVTVPPEPPIIDPADPAADGPVVL